MRLAPRVAPLSLVALLTLAGLLALAGCGSSSSSTSTPASAPTSSSAAVGAGSTVSVAANSEGLLHYEPSSLTAKAGSVSISFKNASPLSHNITVANSSGAVVGATATFTGGTRILALNLKPGSYKFYCTVPGHRAAGMEGTLTVQ